MDATPATPYMLLLFGGKLAMPDPARQMVVVDDWLHLHASARVAGTTSGAPTSRVCACMLTLHTRRHLCWDRLAHSINPSPTTAARPPAGVQACAAHAQHQHGAHYRSHHHVAVQRTHLSIANERVYSGCGIYCTFETGVMHGYLVVEVGGFDSSCCDKRPAPRAPHWFFVRRTCAPKK